MASSKGAIVFRSLDVGANTRVSLLRPADADRETIPSSDDRTAKGPPPSATYAKLRTGILFNHESPRRGETFVTRKITQAAAAIHLGKQDCLYLGNLDARRDWGHARDYAEGMWLILQQSHPDDYVLATGESHSVQELVELAFAEVGIDIQWQGTGADERGICGRTKRTLVSIDPRYFRPTEVDHLLGNPAKARAKLNWKHKIGFRQLAGEMVAIDLELLSSRGSTRA